MGKKWVPELKKWVSELKKWVSEPKKWVSELEKLDFKTRRVGFQNSEWWDGGRYILCYEKNREGKKPVHPRFWSPGLTPSIFKTYVGGVRRTYIKGGVFFMHTSIS